MILWRQNYFRANRGSTFKLKKRDVETWGVQSTNTENGLFCEVENILCPAVLKSKIFAYSLILLFFVEKPYQTQIITLNIYVHMSRGGL